LHVFLINVNLQYMRKNVTFTMQWGLTFLSFLRDIKYAPFICHTVKSYHGHVYKCRNQVPGNWDAEVFSVIYNGGCVFVFCCCTLNPKGNSASFIHLRGGKRITPLFFSFYSQIRSKNFLIRNLLFWRRKIWKNPHLKLSFYAKSPSPRCAFF